MFQMRKLRPQIHTGLQVGHQDYRCDTDAVCVLEEPKTGGDRGVSVCIIRTPDRCWFGVPGKSSGSRGEGGIPFDQMAWCRRWHSRIALMDA